MQYFFPEVNYLPGGVEHLHTIFGGNTVFNSNSILVIEVDTAGNSDKINSSGSVAIDGILRVSPSSGSYTGNNTYTFLTGSSISGTFSTITLLSCSGTVTPTYNSTSVTFTL